MIVTFVSQCEKKALNRTRRVLDAFANRIGSRTWQTVITNEGLQAVKKLLRKTASRNTAVACHWVRSHSRTELVWIVGNRSKFNAQGIVPVNTTRKTIMNTQWENDWRYLPLIKALSAVAALFHDWGKASEFFQSKLKESKVIGDPLRHEWISTLFLHAYVNDAEDDSQWLMRLVAGEFDEADLKQIAAGQTKKPLASLPPVASLICWLIVSHHRLPLPGVQQNRWKGESAKALSTILKRITQEWGYENRRDEDEYRQNVARCFTYDSGLPSQSNAWLKQVKKWGKRLQDCLPLVEQSMKDDCWRLILNYARLSLMLGDHHYSSCDRDEKWFSELDLYANTDRVSGKLKQKLDEHLVGVARDTLRTAHLLPAFEGVDKALPRVFDVKALKRKSPPGFRWQDTAVLKISNWRKSSLKGESCDHFGFFAVNMASTGKGKTFANAKIMRALSPDSDSLRFVLALGLRTLTLQTGGEYRSRIGLDETELGVLIGSRAVLNLHRWRQGQDGLQSTGKINEEAGSESLETLIDNETYYDTEIPEDLLSTILADDTNRERNLKFLYAPVLACTIDHMMAATETRRGGRYILPTLRLMSSDLVIDEIDDFDGKDLVAIGRLIHLAGMLGRKVMISSATIPPDLAEGYFNAYQKGWAIFSKTREVSGRVGCAWIDEFTTQALTISNPGDQKRIEVFSDAHNKFVNKRISSLKKQPAKRKAEIAALEQQERDDRATIEAGFFREIQRAILNLHVRHCAIDQLSQKQVSFGVVRIANIPPCIALARYLAQAEWPDTYDIRVMPYHSQQVLLMRSEQEHHLDQVLKRDGDNEQAVFANPLIRHHLEHSSGKHVIFILVATPVEEVGRDHDFDWAVIEPSSYRSIIQLAGRVLRHRERTLDNANIILLQTNLKALLNGPSKPAYCRPGYESTENRLDSHCLNELMDVKALAQSIDARPRIRRKKQLDPQHNLADLEHEALHRLLTRYAECGPESIQGWLGGCWWMTGLPQYFTPFREGGKQLAIYLIPQDDELVFVEKDSKGNTSVIDKTYNIETLELDEQEEQRLWLPRDYLSLLEALADAKGISIRRAALIYGEMVLPTYGKEPAESGFGYSGALGISATH